MQEDILTHNYVEQIANFHGIEFVSETSMRRRSSPQHLDSSVILESPGSKEPLLFSEQYKKELYFLILDAFITELSNCFDDKNVSVMRAIQACNPIFDNCISPAALKWKRN